MMTRSVLNFALLAVAAAGLACGQTDAPGAGSSSTPAPAAAPATPAAVVHDGRAIEIKGDDSLKFDVTEIVATPGERLSVTLVNVGSMPKFSMGHNWLLLVRDVEIETFLVAAGNAATTDYVPADRQADILATTKLLGPDERDTVTFTAPTEPGEYPFICSFPGHYQVGMRGVLIVR